MFGKFNSVNFEAATLRKLLKVVRTWVAINVSDGNVGDIIIHYDSDVQLWRCKIYYASG